MGTVSTNPQLKPATQTIYQLSLDKAQQATEQRFAAEEAKYSAYFRDRPQFSTATFMQDHPACLLMRTDNEKVIHEGAHTLKIYLQESSMIAKVFGFRKWRGRVSEEDYYIFGYPSANNIYAFARTMHWLKEMNLWEYGVKIWPMREVAIALKSKEPTPRGLIFHYTLSPSFTDPHLFKTISPLKADHTTRELFFHAVGRILTYAEQNGLVILPHIYGAHSDARGAVEHMFFLRRELAVNKETLIIGAIHHIHIHRKDEDLYVKPAYI